ncbi:hypothetical protein MA16_Dca014941 [Dendrobium catenatum]|uniref:Uncharacterized protein n=1 Tax=Dendrobium catenatum TaxID=906689 RepID=A0A2I0W2U6_9ASPA|nr:hypothetical protein MA16_Dca014941 [Dendrobium catenatum]
MAQKKPSRVRWLAFTDYINGLGIIVHFEHIDGKNNILVDSLSRLTFVLCTGFIREETANNIIEEWSKIEMASEQEKERCLLRNFQKYHLNNLSGLESLNQSPPHFTKMMCTKKYYGTHSTGPSTWMNSTNYEEPLLDSKQNKFSQ